jgi:hypothetical protein
MPRAELVAAGATGAALNGQSATSVSGTRWQAARRATDSTGEKWTRQYPSRARRGLCARALSLNSRKL